MLALNSNPMQNDIKPAPDYQPYKPNPQSRISPPESPRNIPSLFEERMSSSHRGLPLPAGLSLPPPERGSSAIPPLAVLPAPPNSWAGHDDSMRSWLHAKAEEDRRKQEEEKTRQEGLRLDQRRIEERMLRDSLAASGGISGPSIALSRLNTADYVPPGHAQRPLNAPPPAQAAPSTEHASSGNALFFHHWTPPNPSGGSNSGNHSNANQPSTPTSKSQQSSPFAQAAASHLRADYQNSPKKRKSTGNHPPPPPPTSAPGDRHSPPSYSGPPSRGEVEGEGDRTVLRESPQRSQEETRHGPRPSSRQRRRDELGGSGGSSISSSGLRRQYIGHSASVSGEYNRYEPLRSETR
ncbi:hypothetical protein DV738_g1591, partial [Chaetothyriales sp. CBS 135597]